MIIEKPKLQPSVIDSLLSRECSEAGLRKRTGEYAVRPRADQYTRAVSGHFCTRILAHSRKVLKSPAQEQIIPTTNVIGRHLDFRVVPIYRRRLPVIIVGLVVKPIKIV